MLENVKKKINKDYMKTEISNVDDGDLDMVMKNKDAIDKKLRGSGMKKYAELGKLMFGMLQDYRKGEYTSPPWFTIAAIGLTLLYVFNPLDMLPDFLPGVGYVDDFALFTVAIRFIESDLHAYLDWKIDEAKQLNS